MFSIVNFLITKRHIIKEFSLKLLFVLLCHHIELSCPPPYDTPVSAASIIFFVYVIVSSSNFDEIEIILSTPSSSINYLS